ncbi:hypothetical protein GGQ84_002888 [Desulfitispora alkaliphila]|uniref:hypothetical protein n=1 Tax=Desulfitispora alkaliphila TaxID=622674 RepID=UPI003D2080C3
MTIYDGRARQIIQVDGKEYHVFSQLSEGEYVIYRNFMISRGAKMICMYKLGVTKIALQINKHKKEFKPPVWLFDQGLAMVVDMIKKDDFSKESGVITSHEMSKGEFNWEKLEPLSLTEEYTV